MNQSISETEIETIDDVNDDIGNSSKINVTMLLMVAHLLLSMSFCIGSVMALINEIDSQAGIHLANSILNSITDEMFTYGVGVGVAHAGITVIAIRLYVAVSVPIDK